MLIDLSHAHARVSQRLENAVMGSQPTFEEKENAFLVVNAANAFLVNAAIASQELYTAGPQIAEPSSFRTTDDPVGNQARASEVPSGSTGYGLVDNEARASQVPFHSPRYGLAGDEAQTSQASSFSSRFNLVDDESHASQARSYSPRYGLVYSEAQAPPSFQYNTSGSDAQYQDFPSRLHYEAPDSGHTQGFSVEQHGETLADGFWNPTEPFNPSPYR